MAEKMYVNVYASQDLIKLTSIRDGEIRAGQQLRTLADKSQEAFESNLKAVYDVGCRYGIILIPEDIGPRANFGRAGSHEAPNALMTYLMNMQANRFFDYSKAVLIGEVDTSDLMARANASDGSVHPLRDLCGELDNRVCPVVKAIAASGLEPIVVGGGNNNSFPTIKGVVEALRDQLSSRDLGMAVINCDAHGDFRRMEGHHSGNPFTYAYSHGFLRRYFVLGLHENYNSGELMERLDMDDCAYATFEEIEIRKTKSFDQAVHEARDYVSRTGLPIGCELDLDSIKDMPSSAKTPFGFTVEQAAHYVHAISSQLDTSYLHLSEAAPCWGTDDGARQVGKAMALLVVTYLKAREQYKSNHGDRLNQSELLRHHQ